MLGTGSTEGYPRAGKQRGSAWFTCTFTPGVRQLHPGGKHFPPGIADHAQETAVTVLPQALGPLTIIFPWLCPQKHLKQCIKCVHFFYYEEDKVKGGNGQFFFFLDFKKMRLKQFKFCKK